MNNKIIPLQQYRISHIPILILNVLESREGVFAVRRFVRAARLQLNGERKKLQRMRDRILGLPMPRRDHLAAAHYFETEKRYHQALAKSLSLLARYAAREKPYLLSKAMSEYEFAHRHREHILELRMRAPALLNERLQRAA